jgi:hypothetical protein
MDLISDFSCALQNGLNKSDLALYIRTRRITQLRMGIEVCWAQAIAGAPGFWFTGLHFLGVSQAIQRVPMTSSEPVWTR